MDKVCREFRQLNIIISMEMRPKWYNQTTLLLTIRETSKIIPINCTCNSNNQILSYKICKKTSKISWVTLIIIELMIKDDAGKTLYNQW